MPTSQDPDPNEAQIVALLAAARARDRAPDSLRARVQRTRAEHERGSGVAGRSGLRRRPGLRVRPAFAVAGAAALAAIAAVLVLALPSGTPGAPTIAQAAALALRGPVAPPPAITKRAKGTTRLGEAVDEVYFPDWNATIGWRATGKRVDTLGGRRAVTVYYMRQGRQVAYTIVATPPLPEPRAQALQAGSMTVRVLQSQGRTVVTWRKEGDTCVLSGVGVSANVLAKLAAWSDQPGT